MGGGGSKGCVAKFSASRAQGKLHRDYQTSTDKWLFSGLDVFYNICINLSTLVALTSTLNAVLLVCLAHIIQKRRISLLRHAFDKVTCPAACCAW